MIRRYEISGFTLVEMLIALAVLSMISLASVTALRTFAQSQMVVENKIEEVEQMRMTLGFIRRSLLKAVPLMHPKGFHTYFEGKSDQLIWVAPMSQIGAKGLHVMRMYTDSDGRLLLQMFPYSNEWKEPHWEDIEAFTIIDSDIVIEFAFRANWQTEWQDSWDLSIESPTTVRVNVSYLDRYWPELVVHMGTSRAIQL